MRLEEAQLLRRVRHQQVLRLLVVQALHASDLYKCAVGRGVGRLRPAYGPDLGGRRSGSWGGVYRRAGVGLLRNTGAGSLQRVLVAVDAAGARAAPRHDDGVSNRTRPPGSTGDAQSCGSPRVAAGNQGREVQRGRAPPDRPAVNQPRTASSRGHRGTPNGAPPLGLARENRSVYDEGTDRFLVAEAGEFRPRWLRGSRRGVGRRGCAPRGVEKVYPTAQEASSDSRDLSLHPSAKSAFFKVGIRDGASRERRQHQQCARPAAGAPRPARDL